MLTHSKAAAERKTERVSAMAMVTATGHSCIGMMGSESPFIVFELPGSRKLVWHSDNVEAIAKRFGFLNFRDMEGRYIHVEANVRPAKRQLQDGIERLQVQRMINLIDQ